MTKALIIAGLLAAALAAPVQAQSVNGVWPTEAKNAHVQIAPCADAAQGPLCGTVVKLLDAPETAVDRHNPDLNLRGRKIMGLVLLYGFRKGSAPNSFEGGKIYKTDEGKAYDASVALQADGTSHVRGTSGIFGKTQTWTRIQ